MIWTKEQTKALTDRVLSFSKAEQTFVAVNGSERASLRFARNTATTSGAIVRHEPRHHGELRQAVGDGHDLAVRRREPAARVEEGRRDRQGVAGESRGDAVSRAADLSRRSTAYFDDAATASPEWRASSVETAIALSKKKEVVSAGFVETQAAMQAVASSQGLFAYDRFTAADYNLTARTPDGSGSGWASKSFNELRLLQPGALAETAIEKAAHGEEPVGIEPGKYTVILEPAALADMLVFMLFSADARQADEGRSFFSKKGGGNRVGESDRRRQGPHLFGPGASARAEHLVRQRGPPDREERLGRERRVEGSLLLAVLGGEDGEEANRGSGERHHGGRQRDDGRSDCRHRARRAGDAVLVHPAPRSADDPA